MSVEDALRADGRGRPGSSLASRYPVHAELDLACPMRDGVLLRADVYRPQTRVPVPALVMRLPYGKQAWFAQGVPRPADIASAGYIVVVQDVRGRYASDGSFGSVAQESDDGYDTVQWAAGLPGCDGSVGTFGPSYLAHAQWAAALERPPALKSMVPMYAPNHSFIDGFIVRGGTVELGGRLGWAHGAIAPNELERLAGFSAEKRGEILARAQGLFESNAVYRQRPFHDLDVNEPVVRAAIQVWGETLEEIDRLPTRTKGRYEDIEQPVFLIAGWYDLFLGETLAQYAGMSQRPGGPPAHLVIGPWSHLEADRRLGDIDFGQAAAHTHMGGDLSLEDQHVRWFDATLKGVTEPLENIAPVRLFVMGSNQWASFDQFPPSAESTAWYLTEGGGLSRRPPAVPGSVGYVYDPDSPVPTAGGATLMLGHEAGPKDQGGIQARADVVSFVSEPVEQPTTVIGFIRVTLFASSSAVDTDFVARLCDDHPDGRSINIADGIIRASRRESYDHSGPLTAVPATPIVPGRAHEYRLNLWATAHTFQPGHRIRVDITSSSFPRWDPNLNTGQSSWNTAEARPARQRVHVGGATASVIDLPVVTIASAKHPISLSNCHFNDWRYAVAMKRQVTLRRTAVLGLALAAAIPLTACAGGSGGSTGSSSGQSGTAGGTITMGLSSAPVSLDPSTSATGLYVNYIVPAYASLLDEGSSGQIIAGLADKWGYVGSDNETFQLTLRSGLKWADGTPITAGDVVASLKYFAKGSGPSSPYLHGMTFTAQGAGTVVIKSPSPDPMIPDLLTPEYLAGAIISPAGLKHPASLANSTDGAGPYVYNSAQSVPNDHYVYMPNKYYYDQSAIHYKSITVKVIPDMNSALQALQSGQIDFMPGNLDVASSVQGSTSVQVLSAPTLWAGLYLLDRNGTVVPALKDPRVRAALNFAINRQAITSAVYGKYGTPLSQPAVPGTDGYSSSAGDVYTYDPAKAKQLLAEAGYAKGLTIPVNYGSFDPDNSKLVQAVQAELAQVGVTLQLKADSNFGGWVSDLVSKKFAATILSPGAGGSEFFIASSTFMPGGIMNIFGDQDPRLSTAFNALSAASQAQRTAAAQQVNDIAVQDALALPVSASSTIVLYTPALHGVQFLPGGYLTPVTAWTSS
jgi:peptide/nickel transport system substrate-binding protein